MQTRKEFKFTVSIPELTDGQCQESLQHEKLFQNLTISFYIFFQLFPKYYLQKRKKMSKWALAINVFSKATILTENQGAHLMYPNSLNNTAFLSKRDKKIYFF